MAYTDKEHAQALTVALARQKKELCGWYAEEYLNKIAIMATKNRIKVYLAYALGLITPIVLTIVIAVYTM